MIDILILFCIIKKELTMYGIKKVIQDLFAPYTRPSFGALKPALTKLEKEGCIVSRRTISDGGKQFGYYSITNEGLKYLKQLLTDDITDNPINFSATASIKLCCASILNEEDRVILYHNLKNKALEHKFEAENILNDEYISLDFHQKIVLNQTTCEYQNIVNMIEDLEKNNGSNSK